ncbi:MAG: hypothetical protein ACRD0K_25815 [Egibacteraceae bacterium]
MCWIIGKANELFAASGERMLVKDLMAHFGLTQSSISQRPATLLKAAGCDQSTYGEIRLGSPAFLVSSRRRRIIQRRDDYQAAAE